VEGIHRLKTRRLRYALVDERVNGRSGPSCPINDVFDPRDDCLHQDDQKGENLLVERPDDLRPAVQFGQNRIADGEESDEEDQEDCDTSQAIERGEPNSALWIQPGIKKFAGGRISASLTLSYHFFFSLGICGVGLHRAYLYKSAKTQLASSIPYSMHFVKSHSDSENVL
jgi:hypothetical protein